MEEADIYSRFNFLLETDATYILDEALKMLQDEREYEKLSDSQRTPQVAANHRHQGASQLPSHFPSICQAACCRGMGMQDHVSRVKVCLSSLPKKRL